MSKVSLCFGDKIALYHTRPQSGSGFVTSTNNSQFPVAMSPLAPGQRVPDNFENCIFQILSGDGDIKSSLTFNRGSPVLYGQTVRLMHVKTYSLLCCGKKLKAYKEKANFKITLEAMTDEAKGTRWRIMPKYKVRGEGERVCSDDDVIFQLHGHQMCLHTCSVPVETEGRDVKLYYEANSSSVIDGAGVGFQLHAFETTRAATTSRVRTISGGDCIVFLHKQEGGPLCAFRRTTDGTPQVRIEPQTAEYTSKFSFASTSLFLTEFADPMRGGVMQLGKNKQYRLKSLSTGEYLCVRQLGEEEEDPNAGSHQNNANNMYEDSIVSGPDIVTYLEDVELTLEGDPTKPGTLFCLHQTTDDPDSAVKHGTRVLLECVNFRAGVWLCAGKPEAHRKSVIAISKTPNKDVMLSAEPNQRDAFEIRAVDKDTYQQLYFVMSLIPSLQTYAEAFLKGVPNEQQVNSAKDSLSQLIRYCTKSADDDVMRREGIPVRMAQRMLVDQNVPELCMYMMSCTFSDNNPVKLLPENLTTTGFIPRSDGVRYTDIREVCMLSMRLIRATCRGYILGGLQMQPLLKQLVSYMFHGIGAAICLEGVCRDHVDLIDNPEDHFLIDATIEQTQANPFTPRYLSLLSVFCGCNGKAVPGNQDHITTQLLSSDLFLRLEFNSSRGLMVVSPYNPLTGRTSPYSEPFWDFVFVDPNAKPVDLVGTNVVTKPILVEYFATQMTFLGNVMMGRNQKALEIITRLIPFDTLCYILDHAETKGLRADIHAAVLHVLHHAYVDREPHRPCDTSVIVKVWGKLEEEVQGKRQPMPATMAPVVKYCLDHLLEHSALSHRKHDSESNKRTQAIVLLTQTIFSFGWIADKEIMHLVKALVSVLDSSNDMAPEHVPTARQAVAAYDKYAHTEHSVTLLVCKTHVVHFLNYIFEVMCLDSANTFIRAFEQNASLPHLSSIYDTDSTTQLHKLSAERQKETSNALIAGLGAMANFAVGGVTNVAKMGKGLVGKIVPFGQDTAVNPYQHLNDLHHALLDGILYKYEELASTSLRVLLRVFNFPLEVNGLLSRVQLLLSDEGVSMFHHVAAVFESMKQLTRGRISTAKAVDLTSYVGELVAMLSDEPKDLFERQTMLMNLGIMDIVVRILKTPFRNSPKQRTIRGLLETTFTMLTLLCTYNETIATAIFHHLDLFLPFMEFEIGVIELLVMILDESLELCNSIPESLFRHVINLMVDKSLHPMYVLFLRKVIWVDDKPVQRVQELLWKVITEKHMSSDTPDGRLLQIAEVWTKEKGTMMRDALLDSKEYEQPTGRISFHLQWMSLLYAIVKGKDLRVKRELSSIGFMSSGIQDVLEVVTNSTLPIFYRSAYIRILQEVYIDDPLMSAESLLEESEKLVEFFTICLKDVRALVAALRTVDEPLELRILSNKLHAHTDMIGEDRETSDPTDIESTLFHVLNIILPSTKHFFTAIITRAGDTFEDSEFKKELYAVVAQLAREFIALVELDQRNQKVNCDKCGLEENVYAIPQLSPSRRLCGTKDLEIVFPSETTMLSVTHHCIFRLTPTDRKRIKDLLVELDGRGVVSSFTKEVETCVTGLQSDMNVQPPKPKAREKPARSEDAKVFDRWDDFVTGHYNSLEGERSLSLALYLLSRERICEKVLRAAVKLLRSPELKDDTRTEVFRLLGRVITAQDPAKQNDIWIVYPPAEEPPLAVDDAEGTYEIVIHKSEEDRQCILNKVTDLAAVIVEFSGHTDAIAQAALVLGNTFLNGGNVEVQNAMYQYCLEKTDEEFFQTNRNRLVEFQSMVKEKKHMVKRLTGMKDSIELPQIVIDKVTAMIDFDVIERNLRFLQLLCEGHNLGLQDYLRVQRDNQISVDVVESCAGLLLAIIKGRIDRITYNVCVQCIATLTEFVQGPCVGNQARLINSNIGESITLLLKTDWVDITEQENWTLKELVVTFLISLIEGKISVVLAAELVQSLSLSALARMMDVAHGAWMDRNDVSGNVLLRGVSAGMSIVKGLVDPEDDDGTDELNLGCLAFTFFKAMVDLVGRTPVPNPEDYWNSIFDREHMTVKDTLRKHSSYKFFNTLVGSIEINRSGALEKAYFRVPQTAVHNLRKSAREALLKDVDRDSLNTKLNDFFEKGQDLVFEIKFFEELAKTRGLAVIHKYYPHFDNLSILLSVVVNVFMLATVHEDHYRSHEWDIPTGAAAEFFYVLGYIIITVQVLLTLHFIFGSLRIHIEYKWREWEESLRDDAVKESKANMALDPPVFDDNAKNKLSWPRFIARNTFYIMSHWPFWQRVLFMVASVLGTEVHPFFYSIQLLQWIQKSPTLQNVVLSVTKNGRSLLLTIGLMVVVVYMFSLIAYYEFSGAFTHPDRGEDFECVSLAQCLAVLLVYGLRAGGGIGDELAPVQYDGRMRYLFDFLFFAVIIIIFMNIVFGIIIDTFAELREDRQSTEDDQTGTCFICGIDKSTLDRKAARAGGFDSHVERDHNMWQYVFYMHYLTLKDTSELNGQEHYVYQMMKRRDISFFPVGRALILGDDDEGVEEQSTAASGVEETKVMYSAMMVHLDKQFRGLAEIVQHQQQQHHRRDSEQEFAQGGIGLLPSFSMAAVNSARPPTPRGQQF
eukprot:PhM_4_TR8476/c0_g1_i1/m.104088